MTPPALKLPLLRNFKQYCFVRPPVSDGERILGVQTDGTAIAMERDANVVWTRPATRPAHPLASRISCVMRGGILIVSDQAWTALDPADGSERWHLDMSAGLDESAFDGQHIWACRVDPPYAANQCSIIEVSPTTGVARTLQKRAGWVDVLVATGSYVATLAANEITCFAIGDGTQRWSFALQRPSCVPGEPAAVAMPHGFLHSSRLLVGLSGYGLVAIALDTGQIAWETRLDMEGMFAVMAGHRFHVKSGCRLVEIDAYDGSVASDVEIQDPGERLKTGTAGDIVHHGGVLYGATLDGTVFGWDVKTRKLVWSHALGTRVEWSCPPQVFLEALWIMDREGRLHGFELPRGS